MRDINFPKPSALPKVLSIDELKGNAGGQKFQAILTDPVKHKFFDILPTRSQYRLQECLKSYKNRKEMVPKKRKYFIRSRRILLSHYWRLNEGSKHQLEVMLMQSK